MQLWAGVKYGLCALSATLEELDGVLDKDYFDLLSGLGINKNITKAWRTLPTCFFGVGLLDLAMEVTIARINSFVQHFSTDSIIGVTLMTSMEYLQLELGCNTCPLSESYEHFGMLATRSWLKAFWQGLQRFQVQLWIDYSDIPFPRERDQLLRDMFVTAGYAKQDLIRLNKVRIRLESMFLSDITTANGRQIDPLYLIDRPNTASRSTYDWPEERPTAGDFRLWNDAIARITGPGLFLHDSLGPWTNTTHRKWDWKISWDTGDIIHIKPTGLNEYYSSVGGRTRINQVYRRHKISDQALPADALPCSVQLLRPGHVRFLNNGTAMPESDPVNAPFLTTLKSHGGAWMWEHIEADDNDFSWIADALKNGTIIAVTDGSYHQDMAPTISGAGWILYCFRTGKQVTGSFYEHSPTAGAYRGELLGMLALHVFLYAVEDHFNLTGCPTHIWCDCKGALYAIKRRRKRVSTGTKHADVFRALRGVRRKTKTDHQYSHVLAHQDDIMSWDCLSIQAQLNCICDSLAKAAVRRGHFATPRTGRQNLPFEKVAVYVGGTKQTSDVSSDLRYHMGRIQAREWYNSHNIMHPTVFDTVDWPSLHTTVKSKPQMYQIWLSKQATNFCATGKQLHRIDSTASSKCPNCMRPGECARHLNQCPSEGRSQLLRDSVTNLHAWLKQGHTHPELARWVPEYINARGRIKFAELGRMSPMMRELGHCQDAIGWRHFMEGKVAKQFLEIQQIHILSSNTLLTPHAWIRTFISKILDISHAQWIYRNYSKHHRQKGMLQLQAREDVLREISRQLELPPSEIPESAQYLLEIDHTHDGLDGDFVEQQYWLLAIKAARLDGHRQAIGRRRPRPPPPPNDPPPRPTQRQRVAPAASTHSALSASRAPNVSQCTPLNHTHMVPD
jgi:hypothetical protein